ncbi:DUF2339 domain-containing protein [Luteolibacter ambystomatis]|uniref:DUF2339 domain-containing protein n=1 Tax=Luteolibacter ambystomatis TaxID=2824561 RepID=A0A975G892_9BACT|nr:DUF2339 domain-containing protein [Luteolibacter ambystomatis]QUE50632.1 DUF2339 domain-containing protein [Luteolibacter ambystomatis]
MNESSRTAELAAAIDGIRKRLEVLEGKHWEAIIKLKTDLDVLEQQVRMQPKGEELPPVTVPVLEPQAPLLKHLQEAKQSAGPPPLPSVATVPVVSEKPAGIQVAVSPSPRPQATAAATAAQVPPPMPKAEAFEQQLGRVWLVRIGIVLLLTGLVLGANWAYHNWIHRLPPGVRLGMMYLCSFLIGGSGWWLAKKEEYKRYGEVLIAGGLAFFYYCTYAAHHVARVRVIENPVVAAVLLLGAAGLIAAVSWLRQSRATAVMGIILASYATMIQPLDWLSSLSNLFLAVMGIALMLRPGWGGPGIASLVGTYAAFGGWQILGAAGAGHGDERASLWFLPGSWAIFAIPGMLGRFRESLGDRGRAIFTAANNALFFLTFSLLWLNHYGSQGFWKVPAVFGAVLLLMGVIGRKREDTAAASNVIQGLASLSLAVVLKFDGYHLPLAMAGESLALAIAYHRFRKAPEFIFSLLAGMGAFLFEIYLKETGDPTVPLWSGALTALVVLAAALVLRFRAEGKTEARVGTAILFYSAVGLLIYGWVARLGDTWKLPVTCGLSVVCVALSLLVDRRRWLPEVAWASGIFGLMAVPYARLDGTETGSAIALASVLGACVLWHRPKTVPESDLWLTTDPAESPQAFAWLHSLLAPVLLWKLLDQWQPLSALQVAPLAVGAVVLVALARGTRSVRLEITAPFLNIGALCIVWDAILRHQEGVSKAMSFTPAVAAFAMSWLSSWKRDQASTLPQVVISRATLFVAWAAALLYAVPRGFIDLMAVSAAAAFALAWYRKQTATVDAWGWTLASLLAYLYVCVFGEHTRLHGYLFEGVALVLLMAGIALVTPATKPGSPFKPLLEKSLPWLACGLFTLWSTRIAVDEFGWKSVVVLWTVSGFGLVTLGLVLDRITSRKTGFILLALALLKLFVSDVWDFTTFMRVVSFVALGLALLLLGLFYHRFAPMMKKLLDEDAGKEGS